LRTFSDRALSIQPTGVRKMFDLAGDDVISFGLGEPDFQPPKVAIDAFHQAMVDGHNKYTTTAGLPALREQIAHSWNFYQEGLDQSNVCITMSGTNALLNLFLTLVNPGENVLLPEPYFPLYGPDVTICGGEDRYYPCKFENEFIPKIEDLEELIDENTVAILYNFPSNPTGGTLTDSQRDSLLDFARRHDLWIISDEIYARLVWSDWPHVSPASLPGGQERTLVVTGFSKSFAMTGWRLGVLTGPDIAMKAAFACQANANSHVPTFLMPAAEVALVQDDYVDSFCDQYVKTRAILCKGIEEIPGLTLRSPEGAFYAFIDVSGTGMSDIEFADKALTEARVQLIPGSLIQGGEGHVRVSYATDENQIVEGIKRLKNWLS